MTTDRDFVAPNLLLESVDPAEIGVDPIAGSVPELMLWCLSALGQIAKDPKGTTLVVTGDFVLSVQTRLGNHPTAAEFGLSRGSAIVGGKTMLLPDGTIHVLLHGAFFTSRLDQHEQDAATQLVRRTVVHEAQHVAMRQNDQGYQHLDDSDFRNLNLTSAADSVVDEYRAELGVPMSLRADDPSWSPLEVLDALGLALGEVVASYQQHLAVERLVYEVGTAALVAWRGMAYMAALEELHPQHSVVTDEVLTDSRWQRMAASQWPRLTEALKSADAGTTVMTQKEISNLVERVADILGDWLADLGFIWTDNDFRIEQWYFDDRHFQRALGNASLDAAP